MSGKSAKKLRKIALGLATTLDQAGTKIEKRELLARNHTSRLSPSSVHSDEAVITMPAITAVTAYNRPNSLRGIERQLKKGLRNGTLPTA
jgi:hypothetical protein